MRAGFLAIAMAAGQLPAAQAATFTVTTTADGGAGSLRQAILNANANPGSNNITFNISGTGPFSIYPLSALPALDDFTTVDGTNQPGYAGAPVIELNGTDAGGGAAGLLLTNFCNVRGLVINNFSAQGIKLNGVSNTICGNYIGTDLSGTLARGNGDAGVWAASSDNFIGGTNAGDGNVISANDSYGVYIDHGTNTVQGNLIGVTASGTAALGNLYSGVMANGSGGNLIGGANAPARNIISGNSGSGVYLNGGGAIGNVVAGNYIGLNLAGNAAVSNVVAGVYVNGCTSNTIGGGNVISGNGATGIYLTNASWNVVQGNFIGTDAAGKTSVPNQLSGLEIFTAAGNTIGGTNTGAGNVISGNGQQGVVLTGGAAGNCIAGNLIGLSAAGTNALKNNYDGILLSGASSNTIGGTIAAARNVISGNASNGLFIVQTTDSWNTVCGNYIGTDITGTKAIGNNGPSGVLVQGCSNVIGVAVSGGGNVISGNAQLGVWLSGNNGNVTGNFIQGNLIGLNAAGTGSLGNASIGVYLSGAAGNQIGGTTAAARNVISANANNGIYLSGAATTGNQVQGNYVGTDLSGTQAHGNSSDGIYLNGAATNFIGGSAPGAGNLISASGVDGLYLNAASWNVIQGNFIGTKADGTNALGNFYHGVELDVGATNNTVGGTIPGAGNRIAFAQSSLYSGVRVRAGSLNNLISGNSIFSNPELGIDLGNFGVNPNVDCESGVAANAANAGQNYPVLANAYVGASVTRVTGYLDSAPDKTYTLQFFSSPAGDALGYGQGQVFLGQTNVTLGAACSSNFVALLPVSVPVNWVITATATGPNNNTSEFSAWITNVVPVPPLQLAPAGTSGGGDQIAFSWTNNGGSFLLLQTLSLNSPIQWATVTNLPALSNNFEVVTLNSTNAKAFYRLEAP